ncbi:MAG: alcohol dehydrogenase catalytic domain-containing protein [Armatimonadota bacterium]|nr:alcohol dehydrogenase catalytic domain-containing protein [bacterium]
MKGRALVFTDVGRVEVEEQEVAGPQPWEIMVKTEANGICAFEVHAFTGELPIDWFPAVMGHEAVGTVIDTGKDVTQFKVGDKVSSLGFSNYRDYYSIWEGQASRIPDEEQALHHWLGEPPACAVNAIRLIEERNPGNHVTIIGCGFMGLLLVQLGVKHGMDIIARDLNPDRLALAVKYGARTDAPDESSQDVVIEASGSEHGLTAAEFFVRNGGVLCLFAHHLPTRVCNTNQWHMKGLDILNATPAASRDWTRDFQEAVQYIRDGAFDLKPLVTHVFDANDPMKAFETITKTRPADYIKGVFKFN